jgi:hypothetical protein
MQRKYLGLQAIQSLHDIPGASHCQAHEKVVVFVKQSGIAGRLETAQRRLCMELILSWPRPDPLLIGPRRHPASLHTSRIEQYQQQLRMEV